MEGNFGLGYRHILDKSYILGGYGYYDLRRSKHKNMLHQVTIGAEFMMSHIEVRINGYLPLNEHRIKDYNLYKIKYEHRIDRTSFKKSNIQVIEKALKGFDIECGGTLPMHDSLSGYLAFYNFFSSGIKSVTGVRLRTNYKLYDWLSFDLESNTDGVRGFTSYLGLNLSWNFDSKHVKQSSLTKLEQKMTQLPVRDIDEV
ncbi:MAG: inverse autotransporter beta domain-containing protein [Legionellales bacterium]|nr:inverse autotransporter beta domain-containing protein [Legionellales bacterium]